MATKYSLEDRYKAALALTATGNSKAASRESNIPASTIRYWDNNDEDFRLMCQEIRTEFGEKIKYKFATIIDESADQVLDRLRNGDVVRDTKSGELVRVPIKGKEAAIIGAIAFDKLRLIENQPTKIVKHETQAKLSRSIDNFNAISNAYDRGDKAEEEKLIQRMGGTPVPGLTKDKED